MTHAKAWLAICGMGNRGTNFEVRGHLPCALMLRSGCDNRSRTGVAVANPLNIQSKDIQIIGMHEPLDGRKRGRLLARKERKICPTPPAGLLARVFELRIGTIGSADNWTRLPAV
jgi:hypothetical protein